MADKQGFADSATVARRATSAGQELATAEAGGPQPGGAAGPADQRPATGLLETLESLAMTLILALIIRGSVLQAYVIPTGSMAPTLLGRHAALVCPNCGYRYARGLSAEGADIDGAYCPNDLYPATVPARTPRERGLWILGYFTISVLAAGAVYLLGRWLYHDEQFAKVASVGSCLVLFYLLLGTLQPVRGGDRIMVDQLYYRVHPPRRWDVIVFRSPEDISRSFIKRLVGLPGDRVEIRSGDVFINGVVSRKPEYAQEAMWQLVYDQRYPPAQLNREVWQGPEGCYRDGPEEVVLLAGPRPVSPPPGERVSTSSARPEPVEGWAPARPTQGPVEVRFVRRELGRSETDITSIYDQCGYDRGLGQNVVGDLRVQGECTLAAPVHTSPTQAGSFWVGILHDQHRYQLRLEAVEGGAMRAVLELDGEPKASVELAGSPQAWHRVELAKVDYSLRAVVDGEVLGPVDLWTGRAQELRSTQSGVVLGATGVEARARRLRIDRDIYYTGSVRGSTSPGRAEVRLGAGEYFVLGDNSPDSRDSRDWSLPLEAEHLSQRALRANAASYARQRPRLLAYGLKLVPQLLEATFQENPTVRQRAEELLGAVSGHPVRQDPSEDLGAALARWQRWWEAEERAPTQVVPERNLLGKPFVVFWPLARVRFIR